MVPEQRNFFWLSFLVIAGINLIVFGPALYHVARSDHVIFLVETEQSPNFATLWNHVVSYPRTRLLNPGDAVLFRPLLFSFVAVERWLFGYNFMLWQAVGILLHLIVLGLLLRLLMRIRPSRWVPLVVLNFSVLYLTQEMVIWQHIHGYLLAFIFMLAAIDQFFLYLHSGQQDRRRFWRMMTFGFLACLTYEFGVVLCLTLAVFLYIHQILVLRKCQSVLRKNPVYSPWLVLMPVVGYIAWSVSDYFIRGVENIHSPQGIDFSAAGAELVKLVGILAGGLLFPQFIQLVSGQRTHLQEFSVSDIYRQWGVCSWGEVFNFVFLALAVVFIGYGGVRVWQGRKRPVISDPAEGLSTVNRVLVMALFFVVFLAYIVMLAVGRLSHGGAQYVDISLYHCYFLVVFLMAAVYSGGFFLNRRVESGRAGLKVLGVAVLILSTVVNAHQAYAFNLRLAGKSAFWRNYIQSVERFRREHAREPGFSFDVLWSQSSRPVEFFVRTAQGEQDIRAPDYDCFFARHIKKDNPAYYLVYSHRFGLAVFQSREQALRYLVGIGVKPIFNGT